MVIFLIVRSDQKNQQKPLAPFAPWRFRNKTMHVQHQRSSFHSLMDLPFHVPLQKYQADASYLLADGRPRFTFYFERDI